MSENCQQIWFECNLTPTNDEGVVFVDRTISFQEVGLQVDVEEVSELRNSAMSHRKDRETSRNSPGETLDSVIDGQDVDSLAVLDIGTRLN
jgi:hypothetical protein